MRKDVFIDEHERSDVMEDQNNFLTRMEDLKLYIVEFEEDNIMKPKIYPSDCAVGCNDCQLIIVITYNECIFSANNGIYKV